MSDVPQTSNRKYSARVFSRAKLHCPHCQTSLSDPEERCGHCGFHLEKCRKIFPFAAPPLDLIIDPSNLLPEGIDKEIRKGYQKVRKRVPQVDISFCFVRLQAGVSIEDFGFWLHNTAPNAEEQRAWQLLVVGDLTSGRLTLTTGYALEPFMKAELWEAALQEVAACIADEQWKEGLSGFLTDARVLLTTAWHLADRRRKNSAHREEREEESASKETRQAAIPQKRRGATRIPSSPSATPVVQEAVKS